MRKSLLISVAVTLFLTGCNTSSEDGQLAKRCERALERVALDDLMEGDDTMGKPSDGEQAIIDSVRKASLATCQAEGLTKEQAACFESIKDLESLFEAGECPAIAAKKPSWLLLPPPEMRKQALEAMKAKRANE